jgi:uncharacterized membrane protein YGL010W
MDMMTGTDSGTHRRSSRPAWSIARLSVGHKLESRKPSFFEDLQYLWVGPLFVLALLFRKLGIRW